MATQNVDQRALPGISLPVIKFVRLDGYELFPGRSGSGFEHRFVPGVTVVAGINGIGKTTFLNILLRTLIGPWDQEKLNPLGVAARSHELLPWQSKTYFSARVSNGAAAATAYVEISIGKHELKLRRNLADLSITSLTFDAQELDPTQDEYLRVVLGATNASTHFDFHFLVRHLVFFLEQRAPLFWNERGQIEAFRILLCDSELANKYQEIQDDILQKDSQYRNQRWHANNRAKHLEKQRRLLANAPTDAVRAEALVSEVNGLRDQMQRLDEAIREAAEEQSAKRTQLLLQKIELEQELRHYEGLQQTYLGAVFPSLEESAQTVFRSLLSGNGCLVCGNRSPEKAARVRRLLAQHDCPVCESIPADQERPIPTDAPAQVELQQLTRRIGELQKSIGQLHTQERQLGEQLIANARDRSVLETQVARAVSDLNRINARMPVTPAQLEGLQAQVTAEGADLKAQEAELQKLYVQFEGLIKRVKAQVASVESSVRSKFSLYAQSFLEERCHLGLSSYKARLGQERTFDYPCFDVYMTSATSPAVETRRQTDADVSESQKEFIDLAFRMALIAAASPNTGKAMLVIETPEASLDSYFVDQAGKMLRAFGAEAPDGGNYVIVSSNLSHQNMIPALLGLSGNKASWPADADVKARLVNMLAEARPNAALRERRHLYQDALDVATQNKRDVQ